MNTEDYIHMDYSVETPEAAVAKVKEIIASTPPERLTPTYLNKLSQYIIDIDCKQLKRQHINPNDYYTTDNHLKGVINRRETSFEGLVSKFENGEDGIYNLIANDKNIIAYPKDGITAEDLAEIPGLRELQEAIKKETERCKNAKGKDAYIIQQSIIAMRKDQYAYKEAYRKPIRMQKPALKSLVHADLTEHYHYNPKTAQIESDALISLLRPQDVSCLLCNYSALKEDSWERFESDMRWLIMDLENLVDKTFKEDYPFYYDLIIYKIDGKRNEEIQQLLYETYNIRNTVEYLSSLWRNKIPKMIAETAQKEALLWYFTFVERGKWKKCSRCGEVKLCHPQFFTRNSSSRDGFYSICKCCRNRKEKK